ncbi:hypothetical protein Q9L42_020240 (plasmid) [Methylomarinum sp. Ch1-1]|uniref:Uncharacterized protein n=1 Tax=Methylomarinum roseum TaxID=3067653 RepID=A0AAU7NZX5_9GAMM|nr:hypothetical protein [Methylomarinum sp. Ch1-1]MDP4523244.1 hypothetical protein [Methylomarinum sp. Ch1-1]
MMKPNIDNRTSNSEYIRDLLENTGLNFDKIAKKLGKTTLSIQQWPEQTNLSKSKDYYPLQYCVESLASRGQSSFGLIPDASQKNQSESYLTTLLLRSSLSLEEAGKLIGRTKEQLINNFTKAKHFDYTLQFMLECLVAHRIYSGGIVSLTKSESKLGASCFQLEEKCLSVSFERPGTKKHEIYELPGDFRSEPFQVLVNLANYAVCLFNAQEQLATFLDAAKISRQSACGILGFVPTDNELNWNLRHLPREINAEPDELIGYFTRADLKKFKNNGTLSTNLALLSEKMAKCWTSAIAE